MAQATRCAAAPAATRCDGGDDADTLEGNGGDDELDGGDGADSMSGGTGNDIYIVDDAGDVVTEYANGGTDTVDASISYTLGNQVENLALTGTGGLNGTGNDRDNVIWGSNYDNLLNGGGGVDAIKGAGGADIIDGGTGADTMLGGDGGDIFIVDNAGDVVTEAIGEGFDWLQTTVSYSLAAGSEVEVLYADPATTTAAINLTGNEFDNFLTGNDGINVLVGGLGIDTLRGSGGGDGFLWSSIGEVGLASPDIVADYSTAQGDVLHFTNIDADETQLNDQDFDFISTAAFTAPGQINWFSNGTDTFIQLNTDADLAADGMIQLSGVLSGELGPDVPVRPRRCGSSRLRRHPPALPCTSSQTRPGGRCTRRFQLGPCQQRVRPGHEDCSGCRPALALAAELNRSSRNASSAAIRGRGRTALPKRQRPLPVEIVAEVLVAIAGIEPETAVQRER